jgi:enoyl-CoA hydratase/carnithine racemase
MSMSTNLLVSREGRTRRLTLNRPAKRNALDMALCRDLVLAMKEAESDPGAGAILIDANGPDFCAGMDLAEAIEKDAADVDALVALHLELFSMGSRMVKPVIAAVQGAALAGGLGLAVNAHVVMAASDARFGLTERRIGLWPCAIFRAVAAATGERKAVELALTARLFDAEEALRLGIVDFITSPAELGERAALLAANIAEGSAAASEEGLRFVRAIGGKDGEAAAALTAEFRRRAHRSPDFQEGVLAFRGKRKPVWPSHDA